MRKTVDPARLEGEELARWYRRTPAEIEADRAQSQQEAEAAFYRGVGTSEAGPHSDLADGEARDDGWGDGPASGRTWVQFDSNRYRATDGPPFAPIRLADASTFRLPPAVTKTPPRVSAPLGPNAAVPIDGRPSAPRPRRHGFFSRYTPVPFPDADVYVTSLPPPLNVVVPGVGGWFGLGDGSVVNDADELDRVYDEQQRRISVEDEPDPPPYTVPEDKLRDGQVPQAGQIAKGHRELDPTCHPDGGWEVDPNFPKYSKRAQEYQAQIVHTRGIDYVVRPPGGKPVKFDGCAVWDPRHQLLDAKGPRYAALMDSIFGAFVFRKLSRQAGRQYEAARGAPIDWHFAERAAADRARPDLTGTISRVMFTPPMAP